MKTNEKQELTRKRLKKLSIAIQEAIDKICKEKNFEVTYAEINASLIDVLKSNNSFELLELCKASDDFHKEQNNNTNELLVKNLPIFTIHDVGHMIYEFMGQYHLEGKYNHCEHTIEAVQEYKLEKLKSFDSKENNKLNLDSNSVEFINWIAENKWYKVIGCDAWEKNGEKIKSTAQLFDLFTENYQ